MNPDDLQRAWQSQDAVDEAPVEDIVSAVLRKSRKLNRHVFWRDVRESVLALIMAPLFVWTGYKLGLRLWPEYLAGALILWIALDIIIDRRLHREVAPGSTARECVEQALREVNHQIRILRGILLWYLAPCALALALLWGDMATQSPFAGWVNTLKSFAWPMAFATAVFAAVYWLNQYAVKTELLPLKEEFEKTLVDLETQN